MKTMRFILAGVTLFLLAATGHASVIVDGKMTLDFYRITANSDEDIAAQLHVDVLNPYAAANVYSLNLNADEVLFVVRNDIGIASNIHEVYFDDGTLEKQLYLINSLRGYTDYNSDWSKKGYLNPPNLPGGEEHNAELYCG